MKVLWLVISICLIVAMSSIFYLQVLFMNSGNYYAGAMEQD